MTSLSSFLQSISNSTEFADLIKAHLNDHLGTHPDNITWANVEDAKRIESALREITAILGHKNTN